MIKLEQITKNEFYYLAFCLILFVLILFCNFQDLTNFAQIAPNLYTAIQYKYNSYFYLTSFGAFLASYYGTKVLLLTGISCSYLILNRLYANSLKTFFATLASWLLVLQIFGLDYSILAPLCFASIFFLSILALQKLKTSTATFFLVTCLAAWLSMFNLALLSLLLGLFLVLILGGRIEASPNEHFSLNAKIFISCSFLLLVLANACSPKMPWPDYPANARITQLFDAPAWNARPLIGADNPIPVLDRLSLRQDLGNLILPCLIAIVLLYLRNRRSTKILVSAACLFLLFCDVRLPESYSQVLPLQGLTRLIPGIADFGVTPIIFACLVFSLTFLIIMQSVSGSLLFLILSAYMFINPPNETTNCSQQYKASPSCLVAKFFSDSTLKLANSDLKKIKPKKDNFIFKSSNPNLTAVELIDRDPATRWSSGTGKQAGNEWIELQFDHQQNAAGVELQTGNFSTDYPRAIEIRAGQSCADKDLELVVQNKNWQGYPLFTEKGYPYFSAQSDVKIFFDRPIEFSCLQIKQTGISDNFDWSIAEFRLLNVKNSEVTELDDN